MAKEIRAARRESGADQIIRAFESACSLWQADIKLLDGKHRLELIRVGASVVFVQDYPDGNGWLAFVPVTASGKIDETLKAIAEHCQVQELQETR